MTIRPSEMFDGPRPPGMPDELQLTLNDLASAVAKLQEMITEQRQTRARLALEQAEACALLRSAGNCIALFMAEAHADPDEDDVTPAIGAYLARVDPR